MTDEKTLTERLRIDARSVGYAAADLIERQAAELAALQDAARINLENYEFQRNKADRATATVYQFHYAMKDAGWHPGRTDDNLCDIIREKGKELAALRASTASVQADQRAELDRLLAENAKLKTVMIAAAEEIQAYWDAHCDADGYGPSNLMRRLEEGIPSEYGYTAGAFAALRSERDALQEALTAGMSKCRGIPDSRCGYLAHCYAPCNKCGRQHDAARTGCGNG